MKKLKRTAAGLLLAGVLCVQALPMTAWAVDLTAGDVAVTDSDTAVTDTAPVLVEATTNAPTEVRCDIDQTDYFTFEDNGDGNYTVTGTTEAFRELENVSLTLAEDVKFIGEAAFANCTNLKSVDFENEEMVLYKDAFHGCSRLKTVAFEKIVRIMDYAFQGCEKLTTVNLTNTKMEAIGSNAFGGCDTLEYVTISVTDKNYEAAYSGTEIFGDTGTPIILTYQLNMDKGEMMQITGKHMYGSNRIKEIHFEGDGDVAIGNDSFQDDKALKYIDFSYVAYVGKDAFEGCENLSEIQLLNKHLSYIGDSAFIGCDNANNIEVALNDGLQMGNLPFGRRESKNGNYKSYSMTIYANNKELYSLPTGFGANDELLNTLEINGSGELFFGEQNFFACTNLTTAKFGNAMGFGKKAFSECLSLKRANLTYATLFREEAFSGCSGLQSLQLGIYDNSQWFSDAFKGIMKQTTDDDGNRINGTLELYMNNKEAFPLGESFGGKTSFASLGFTNMNNLVSVKTYGDGELELHKGQFNSCSNLESFDFSNVTYIGDYTLNGTALKEAKITKKDMIIGEKAFLNCDNLTLYGYTDSTTETYATQNNIPFVALDGGKTTTATSTTGQGSATTTTTVSTTTKSGSDSSVLYGDTTLDGRVDISDAVLLNKATAGSVHLNEQASANADLYKDGDIDGNDSVTLLQFLVHQINSLPVQP